MVLLRFSDDITVAGYPLHYDQQSISIVYAKPDMSWGKDG